MTEQPQFKLVRRGFDPDHVAAKIAELDHALGIARRTAAQRTAEMTRAQEDEASLRTRLDDALARHTEATVEGASASRYADVGPRVTSILALAIQQAEQIRADSERYALDLRESAEKERHQVARHCEARLAESEQLAAAIVAEATVAAGVITDAAHVEAAAQRDQARASQVWATEQRQLLTHQLGEVVGVIDRLEAELSEPPASARSDSRVST